VAAESEQLYDQLPISIKAELDNPIHTRVNCWNSVNWSH